MTEPDWLQESMVETQGCKPEPLATPKRGFAAFSPEKLREISSRGGKAVQASGRAHRWDAETGKAASAKRGPKKAVRG